MTTVFPSAGSPLAAPLLPVVADAAELRAALAEIPHGRRAVVMTMGALHEGHAALIRAARARAEHVTVTIFVNPLQFGPGEDLDRYPRTLGADLDVCAREGADLVFAPRLVHDTPPLVRLAAGPLGELLEGASRPGHFDGMLTIVATLLNLVRPDMAFFGQKDAQQLTLVRRMVDDLGFGVEIVAVPTVRDADGLALSSRNRYLSPAQRRSALALSASLRAGLAAVPGGPDSVVSAARAVLAAEPGIDVDYLALRDAADLGPARPGRSALLLVAARVGSTRLIDNVPLDLPPAPPATGTTATGTTATGTTATGTAGPAVGTATGTAGPAVGTATGAAAGITAVSSPGGSAGPGPE